MLFPIIIVALVCAEINGSTHKNYSQVRGHSKNVLNTKTRPNTKALSDSLPGQRRLFHPGYRTVIGDDVGLPGSNESYVSVGAGGEAEVTFRLDMSVFMERLNMIPKLYQVIEGLTQKIDILIDQPPPGPSEKGKGWRDGIDALQREIFARFDQQDGLINELLKVILQNQKELDGISLQISQVFEMLQNWLMGGGKGGSSKDPSEEVKKCGPVIVMLDRNIRQVMDVVDKIVQILETPPYNPERPGEDGSVLGIVKQNFKMLEQSIVMIEQIGQTVNQSSHCPPGGGPVGPTGPPGSQMVQVMEGLTTIISLIKKLPQETVVILQNVWGPGGGSGPDLQHSQQIIQMIQELDSKLIFMRDAWIDGMREIKKSMAENRKNIVAVRKTVVESTEIVQSSAAAALSASRSLKCSTANQN